MDYFSDSSQEAHKRRKTPELLLSKVQDMIQIYIVKELICNCAHHILYFMSNTKKNYIFTKLGLNFKKKKLI